MKEQFDVLLDRVSKHVEIKNFGLEKESNTPFVRIVEGPVFYGLPIPLDKPVTEEIIMEEPDLEKLFFLSIAMILHDILYRYLHTRSVAQHYQYTPKKGDNVIEVGAFLGYYAMYVAQQVGYDGSVIAIEAIPSNYEILKKNFKTNCPDNATGISMAVGDKKGEVVFYQSTGQIGSMREDVVAKFSNRYNQMSVKSDTLDNITNDLGLGRIDLMIIQVNGNEVDVLNGASDCLERVGNFAVAAPYSRNGQDHKAIVTEILSLKGFDVISKEEFVFARNTRLD